MTWFCQGCQSGSHPDLLTDLQILLQRLPFIIRLSYCHKALFIRYLIPHCGSKSIFFIWMPIQSLMTKINQFWMLKLIICDVFLYDNIHCYYRDTEYNIPFICCWQVGGFHQNYKTIIVNILIKDPIKVYIYS